MLTHTPTHTPIHTLTQMIQNLDFYFSSSVAVQWTGFTDPESGIQHFTWCLGYAPKSCDILGPALVQQGNSAHGTGLNLPEATPLYATVLATNPAGLSTTSVSNSFQGE